MVRSGIVKAEREEVPAKVPAKKSRSGRSNWPKRGVKVKQEPGALKGKVEPKLRKVHTKEVGVQTDEVFARNLTWCYHVGSEGASGWVGAGRTLTDLEKILYGGTAPIVKSEL